MFKKLLLTFFTLLSVSASSDAGGSTSMEIDLRQIRQDQRDEEDLEAQKEMAKWAFWTMIASVTAAVTTFASLYFVRLTLNETRQDVETGRRALEGNRAWVMLEGFTAARADFAIDTVDTKNGLFAFLKWINRGGSPALNLDIYIEAVYLPAGSKVPVFEASYHKGKRGSLGPQVTVKTPTKGILSHQADALRSKKGQWYIYSKAEYDDIYGHQRTTEVCCRILHAGSESPPFGPPKDLYDLEFVGDQNTMT